MLIRIEEPIPTQAHAPSLNAFLELGFRPLYLAGAAWAVIAIALWIFFPQGITGVLQGISWHAHEMLWGFIVTIAVGFLMTAGANWTGINPLPGRALAAACVCWIIARLSYLLPGSASLWSGAVAESLFLFGSATGMLMAVIRAKSHRNLGVPLVLVGLGIANLLLIRAVHAGEIAIAMKWFHTGLLLMAMLALLVGRRVIPFFAMRAVHGLDIPKHMRTGQLQLVLAALALAGMLVEHATMTALALAITGMVSLWQVISWKPLAVSKRPILWVLYLGYAMCGIGLMAAAGRYIDPSQRAAWSVHTIAMGGFSVLIIGMITRTALGHLGRALELSSTMVGCYWLVIVATAMRLSALVWPAASSVLLPTSALAWMAAFAIYLWEFTPMMVRARPKMPALTPAPMPTKR